ncbi:hypothetical protein [Ralstonia pseudosolanacearum]|nr:hypothetical protein [Ralstonia pseudosolanacearum]
MKSTARAPPSAMGAFTRAVRGGTPRHPAISSMQGVSPEAQPAPAA